MARPTPAPSAKFTGAPRRRGRPPKFDRPAQTVALTLPNDVVAGLREIDRDLAWAIVSLVEKRTTKPAASPSPRPAAELVTIATRRALIVVDKAIFRNLPGIHVVPLSGGRAFLALEPGRGMSDLELAVLDRLDDGSLAQAERDALRALRSQLHEWRRDPGLRFHARAIIVVEQVRRRRQRSI